MQRFTDKGIKALEPREKAYDLREGDGFGVRVLPSGTKSWFYFYHVQGKKKRLGLGTYPATSLKEAHQKHADAKKFLEAGTDPAAVRDEQRAAPTVEALVDDYMERWAKRRKRSWQQDERQLKKDVVPRWGYRKAQDIERQDVVRLMDEVVARGSPIAANRLLAVVRRVFNWAVEVGILEHSPAFRVKAPAKERRKERVLSPEEIRVFWSATEGATEEIRRGLKLILVTAQRPGEVIGARWEEFDLEEGWWTIPGDRAKNGQAHRVPLSPLALKILGTPGKGYLFPSPSGEEPAPMNPTALARATYRHARMEPLPVKSKSRGIRKRHKPPVAWGVEPFTPHDLRRTGASLMTGIGIPRLVVAKLLNHAEPGVTAIYDRHSYDLEKREALDRWGSRLLQIVQGEAGKVVRIRQRAKAWTA